MDAPKKSELLNDLFSAYIQEQMLLPGVGVSDLNVSYGIFFKSKSKIINLIHVGVSYALFDAVKSVLPFSDQQWAAFLGTSTKSLQRYKADITHVFKSFHSEKIVSLAEVIYFGLEVFDTEAQFFDWFNTVSYALGGLRPIDLVKDAYGKDLVLEEIHRIEYGVFA